MTAHIFDIGIAKKVGVNAAILFHNISFWIEKNEANNKNFKDGRFWTYNSTTAFCELFPYLTKNQIRTAIEKLVEHNYIIKGSYNKASYDKTTWFALSAICEKTQIDVGKNPNGCGFKPEPIPDGKPVGKPVGKPSLSDSANPEPEEKVDSSFEQVKEVVEFLNAKTGKQFRCTTVPTKKVIMARIHEGFTVEQIKRVISVKTEEWGGTSHSKYLRPETLFGNKFEGYLNQQNDHTEQDLVQEWRTLGHSGFRAKYGYNKTIEVEDIVTANAR